MHRLVPRGAARAVLLLVCLGLVSLAGAGAGQTDTGPGADPATDPHEATEQGWILIPTDSVSRLFQPLTLHRLTLWYIDTVAPGAPFALEPQRQGFGVCTLGQCAQTGDFDIIFFKEGATGLTSVVGRYDALGDERGEVPADATFAVVYLKTPHAMMDDARGWGFYYLQGDPGRDRLPQIGP